VPRLRCAARHITAAALVLAYGASAAAAAPAPRSLTRSQARAVASEFLLRHSDLPTLTQQPNPQTAQDRELSARASACAHGVPTSRSYANPQSPAFVSSTEPTVAIASGVEILPSRALVATDFHAIEQSRALPCLLAELDTQLRTTLPASDKVGTGAIKRLPGVMSGIEQSFALRISFPVAVKSGTTTSTTVLYFDQVGFGFGQAEVSFEVQSNGVVPSSSLERRLGGVLLARARAALG
jgi:hypothetical protein